MPAILHRLTRLAQRLDLLHATLDTPRSEPLPSRVAGEARRTLSEAHTLLALRESPPNTSDPVQIFVQTERARRALATQIHQARQAAYKKSGETYARSGW